MACFTEIREVAEQYYQNTIEDISEEEAAVEKAKYEAFVQYLDEIEGSEKMQGGRRSKKTKRRSHTRKTKKRVGK